MSSERLNTSCPVDHGDFTDEQNLTDAQKIIQKAAIDVHKYPLLVAETSMECDRQLGVRYLRDRDMYSSAYHLTDYDIQGGVRRIATQALGFRAVYAAMPSIKETIESGFRSTDSRPLQTKYDAPFGHAHTGDEARLMRLVSGRLGRMTVRTFGSFKMEERLVLQNDFEERTRRAAASTVRALDYKYGQSWRELPKEIRQAPHESDLEDRHLVRLLGRLVHRSYSLETSFHNAAISGAESGTIMIKHFREALYRAECPKSLWVPLMYANATKLSLPASMTFWDAKQLHEVDVQEQSQSIFTAYKHDGNWQIDFTSQKYKRTYERNRPVGCQGAFVLPGQSEADHAKLLDWHEFMEERSQGLRMDTNYRQGTSSAQMATLSAVAIADREDYL
jgi:hypothetical protein